MPTVWATLRGWGKDERRSVFQAVNLTILLTALAVHAAAGLLTAEFGKLFVGALPGTLLGAWLGALTYRRLTDKPCVRFYSNARCSIPSADTLNNPCSQSLAFLTCSKIA